MSWLWTAQGSTVDPRLLDYYNRELRHLREIGGEFAGEFPKIASRLALDSFECADPYVERLLEGFAFLAARVQLKIDAEFPRFTSHLLEFAYPHYLAPTPSMAVVQFKPDTSEASLQDGLPVLRHTSLRSQIGKGEQTACEYRTAQDITLWPLEIVVAEYLSSPNAITNLGAPSLPGLKAGIRLRLRTTTGQPFNQIAVDNLPIFLRGSGSLPVQLYEQFLANAFAVAVLPTKKDDDWCEVITKSPIRMLGFEDSQAILPFGPRSFQGYRLLHEYFAFPERFLFVELTGLREAARRCETAELDLIIMLDRQQPKLINSLEPSQFALFCVPIINLFPRRVDRIHLTQMEPEYHVIPDRTRPLDFEVYELTEVVGYGANQNEERAFLPFYGSNSGYRHRAENAYYTIERRKRLLSAKQRRQGLRSSYVGSETYISLVDAMETPYSGELKQLGLQSLCTNRDLPLHMPVGQGATDFDLVTGGTIRSIRCIAGPTRPRPSVAGGGATWRLISHLSLNYLSLMDTDRLQGAAALREMLTLYGDPNDDAVRKQIEGVLSTQTKNVVRRVDAVGPIVFGRGVEVTVKFEESAFEGGGAFLLGAVLDHFFARYASLNTFTETVITTADRGEIMRWPIRIGRRQTL
ncbi:MAG: type VI secretion system baseplate subunit TssF [Proteobacteria bacterium]|nr:type VI secretion system baseplate subunit TssF [Pseudomonadota bacterium]